MDMEHNQPSSSSIFLDLSSTTSQVEDGSEDGDRVLPHISRMLMEESIVDKFLYQYPDHPALVQAQQLFSHILSDALTAQPSNSVEHSTVQPSTPAHNIKDPAMDAVEHNSSIPAESSSSNFKDVVSMAFFKGMEEASKFLPSDGVTAGVSRGQKKRLDVDGDDEAVESGTSRSSKQMAADCEDDLDGEAAAREMLDHLMLNGCEPNMEELRATMELEEKKTPRRRRGSNGAVVVDLHAMLIRCAEAMAADDRHGVANLLDRIRRHSSPGGDGTQRLAHYFADGLEARLASGTGSHHRPPPMASRGRGGSLAGFLKAFQVYMATCCFLPVIFLFSSETICGAVAGRKKLHIVSYGLAHGLQWPDLLRRLAHRDGGPPEVRLTGVDLPLPGFRPSQLMDDTGRRLSDCARQLGVPFKFRGITARPEAVRADDLDIDPDEVLVVDSLLHFRSLTDEVVLDGKNTNARNTMDTVLNAIREMRPCVFIHAVVNASHDAAFFTTRFREVLYNSSAMFDVMDTVLPRDDERRMLFEREVLARCAVNDIACEGEDLAQRPRSYRQWQARSQRAGLRQLPLERGVVRMLKEKVKGEYHRCFEVSEDRQWLLQGWKGRVLFALSTWTAGDDLA